MRTITVTATYQVEVEFTIQVSGDDHGDPAGFEAELDELRDNTASWLGEGIMPTTYGSGRLLGFEAGDLHENFTLVDVSILLPDSADSAYTEDNS